MAWKGFGTGLIVWCCHILDSYQGKLWQSNHSKTNIIREWRDFSYIKLAKDHTVNWSLSLGFSKCTSRELWIWVHNKIGMISRNRSYHKIIVFHLSYNIFMALRLQHCDYGHLTIFSSNVFLKRFIGIYTTYRKKKTAAKIEVRYISGTAALQNCC